MHDFQECTDWVFVLISFPCREVNSTRECRRQAAQSSPFLSKIIMVGVSTGEAVQLSKAALKKTILDVMKELEQVEQGNLADSTRD